METLRMRSDLPYDLVDQVLHPVVDFLKTGHNYKCNQSITKNSSLIFYVFEKVSRVTLKTRYKRNIFAQFEILDNPKFE